MNHDTLRGKAAIVGFGDAYTLAGEKRSVFNLSMAAVRAALDDAGLRKDQIDGVFTGRAPLPDQRVQWNNIFCAYLKITPRISTEVSVHAAGMNSMLKYAAMAVDSGIAKYVLCVGVDTSVFNDLRAEIAHVDADPEFEQPYRTIIPSLYAQVASRLMHEYGITEEDLAAPSIECQNWGVHHPHAAKRNKGRITVDDVLNSRIISYPLRLWNCTTWHPGTAGALIVASAENARAIHPKPIYILGSSECETHEYITDRMALRNASVPLGKTPNLTATGCRVAARSAFEMAGVGLGDIDILQTPSNFSHSELLSLSELGFTTLPEVGDFIRSGAIGIQGHLPTNTNGGWMSFGQPGAVCVMDSVIETVRQLRGKALGLQVPDPEVACIHSLGGIFACQSVTVLSTST